jgi:hypothetical protein
MTNLIDGAGGVFLFVLLAMCWHYVAISRKNEWALLGYLFFLMFVARGSIALLNTVFQILPPQMDALRYDAAASAVSALFRSGDLATIFDPANLLGFVEPGYTIPLGLFYFVLGKSILVGFILNTFFFSLTALNVYRIGNILFGFRGAILAAFLFLILPYSVLHSTYLYRDPWVNFFMSEFFYRLLILSRGERQSALQWLWIVFVFMYSGILRRENLVMLTAIIGFLMFRRVLVSKTLLKPIIITSTIFLFLAAAIIIYQNADNWVLKNFKSLAEVEMLNDRMESYDSAQSSYLQNESYSSYWDIVKYAPIRAVYFMFSPLPWDIFKKSQYIPFFEAVLIGCFLVFLPGALWKIKKQNISYFYAVSLYLVCGILGSGLIQSNSAGAQRHRTQFTFLIVAIAVPYLYNTLIRRISIAGRKEQKCPQVDFQYE